ncbi:uncharacterized protein BCR38DRAFT_485401 [Pseudomassariella vexata]|uniref:Uncharacterized protein n=1 Tax=Pseudomassariella vexata TaxID=1141098 RepID=A0A1Y2DYD3_9PEZI|nr:uncharacterized protein BCR38DRAFT_485401 [Pseudomassariella vexata]ORY64263.1 hypothetical protein BCR38DRAFT_485401 [Pseudomassariella vexata]
MSQSTSTTAATQVVTDVAPDAAVATILRDAPCCRCLDAMAKWSPSEEEPEPPQCRESTSASGKCARCAAMRGKLCTPVFPLPECRS